MGNTAFGSLGIALEDLSKRGMQLLYSGPVSATLSLTTQPSGSTGMRLFLAVQGNTTTGTVSITGTGIDGSPVTEVTPTIPIQDSTSQSVEVNDFEYVTEDVFATVNASGVVTTGLADARLIIYGIRSAKYLIPSMAEMEEAFEYFSPDEHRGVLDRDTNNLQLIKPIEIGSIEQSLYPEASLFAAYMAIEATPAVTTIPASPTSLKASATASPITLTTPPTPPGMKLIFVVSGSSATGSLLITGANEFGQAVNETIAANAGGTNGNGTYYSANVYSSVTNVVVTGLTGFSINISGVYGWRYEFTPDNNPLYSAAFEWFTGTDSNALPFSYLTDLEISFATDAETTLSLQGGAQDMLPIGDRSTNPLDASRVTQLGQPMDTPTVGWQTLVFIDQLGGTPASTAYSSTIEGTITLAVPQMPIYTATNSQRFSKLYRGKREASLTMTIDFDNLLQYEVFRKNLRQFLAVQFIGSYIGSISGTVYSKSWTFIFPAQYISFSRDTGDENVKVEIEAKGIYTPSLGYSHKCIVICQQPPVLPN